MSGLESQDNQELEAVETIQDEVNQEIEQSEDSSGMTTETDKEGKKPDIVFNPDQQKVFDKAMHERTFRLREAERKLEAERQERIRYEQELERLKAPAIEVPPMPDDPFAEDYQVRLTNWQQAVQLKAAHDARQEQIKQAQALQQQQEANRRQQEIEQNVANYKANATKLGVKQEELVMAAQTVANYGINEDLVLAIIGDDHGALITTYLANNIDDLDRVVRMSPIQAAMFIANEIKPKAVARKPKVSSAPEPTPRITGNGAERENPLLKGATFT